MTLKEALSAFIQRLEPTAAERSAVKGAYGPLIARCMKPLALDPAKQAFLAGSWGRSTAITPLHDVDIFAVLSVTPDRDQQKHRPSEVLSQVERALRALHPGVRVLRQRRSIQLAGLVPGAPQLGFDVVPAFRNPDHPDRYHIPDERGDLWIRTNPELHKRRLDSGDPQLRSFIKVVKRWNRHKNFQFKSFYIEVMCLSALTGPSGGQMSGLKATFEGLARVVRAPVRDPAELGPNLDGDKPKVERDRLAGLFLEAASEIGRAQADEASGRLDLAHHRMRTLLGPDWPT